MEHHSLYNGPWTFHLSVVYVHQAKTKILPTEVLVQNIKQIM